MSTQILFVIEKYFPYGGLQRDMLNIAKRIMQCGVSVTVLTSEWQGEKLPGLNIVMVDKLGFANHVKTKNLEHALAKHLTNHRYDCVVGFNKLAGIDILYDANPCFAEKIKQNKPAWITCLPRYSAYLQQERSVFAKGNNAKVLLIAHDQAPIYQSYYETESERLVLLAPGIVRERLQPVSKQECGELRKQLGIDAADTMLLMLGSAFHTKGVDRSIAAIAALPTQIKHKTHLVIVGRGNSDKYYKLAKQKDVADNIHFAGANEQISPFYYAADLLIHPARTENTGTVLLEAICCGLPVLATANCGYAMHVQRAGAGMLCPMPFRQAQLNQLLLAMLTDNKQAGRSQSAKRYSETEDLYSLFDTAANYIVNSAGVSS